MVVGSSPTWRAIFQGEQHAPNKTNLLPPRVGIFRFLYSERVSEVWEGEIQYILIYINIYKTATYIKIKVDMTFELV